MYLPGRHRKSERTPARSRLAASQKSKALSAYKKFLSKSYVKIGYGKDENYKAYPKNWKFALAYIDNDSVPELVIDAGYDYRSYPCTMVYAYTGGKVKKVSEETGHGATFKYYKKKGMLRYDWAYHGYASKDYVRYNSGKGTHFLSAYTDRDGSEAYYKGSWSGRPYENEISKSLLLKNLRKYVGTTTPTKAVYHKNTSSNRTKYLK